MLLWFWQWKKCRQLVIFLGLISQIKEIWCKNQGVISVNMPSFWKVLRTFHHSGQKFIGVHVGHYFWIFGGYNMQNLGPLESFKVQNRRGKIRLSKKSMLMPIQSTFTWNVFNQPKELISLWQGKRSKINIKWKFYSSVNLQIEI